MLERNLKDIQTRIGSACEASGRNPEEITLIAVSKTFSEDHIKRAYDLGLRHFGESRFQEAQPKIEVLPGDIHWHFIGHLQSNKAKKVAQYFDTIHTFCTESQIKEVEKIEGQVEALVEVNIAEEAQKSGIPVKILDEYIKKLLQCSHAQFLGLMTIGPNKLDPEEMRPYFKRMQELREKHGGQFLSIGMSKDFEIAIQEGATHIRVGTALFGDR